jgi:hypothetical protein
VCAVEIFDPSPWQMTLGERAALEGVLSQLHPRLAVEIGTAEGGSLRRIAAHSGHVHSFDLVRPDPSMADLENVTLHTGDSRVLLAKALEGFAERGDNVDFALVDGDHTADGVEHDMRQLLASEAVSRTVIVAHDTLNDDVRAGLRRIDYASDPKVAYFDLDFVGGHLSRGGDFDGQLWGGFALVLVDVKPRQPSTESQFYDLFDLFSIARQALLGGGDSRQAQAQLEQIQRSASWRITAPLRAAKRGVLRRQP